MARQLEEADEVLSKAIGDLAATRPPFAHEELFASPICVAAKAESRKPSDSSGRPSPTPWPLGMAELSLDRDDPGGAIPVAEQVLRHLPTANKTQRAVA